MIPILIVGGTPEERAAAAEVGSGKWEITDTEVGSFDILKTGESNLASIGIDQIRSLQHQLSLKPVSQKEQRTVFIQEAQNLTLEAQNALLKTLEEPPKQTLIILAAPNLESLLPTVVSRCQLVKLKLKPQISLSTEETSQYLNLLISFLSSSLSQRLQRLDELDLTRDRQKAIDWINIQTVVVRQILLNRLLPQPSSPLAPLTPLSLADLLATLNSLLLTRTYLEANVNIRLTLDSFLLDLPKI